MTAVTADTGQPVLGTKEGTVVRERYRTLTTKMHQCRTKELEVEFNLSGEKTSERCGNKSVEKVMERSGTNGVRSHRRTEHCCADDIPARQNKHWAQMS